MTARPQDAFLRCAWREEQLGAVDLTGVIPHRGSRPLRQRLTQALSSRG